MKQMRNFFAGSASLALALVGVACFATACSSKKTPPASTQSSPPNPALSASSPEQTGHGLAQFTLGELQHLKDGISLDAWKKLHSTDVMEIYAYKLTGYPNENWCARMSSEIPLDSDRKIKQTAYFYLPPEPDPPMLSAEARPEELIGQCRLGFLWTEVEHPAAAVVDADSPDPDPVIDALRKSIGGAMGTGQFNVKLQWMGSAGWRKTALWENAGLSVASAIRYGFPNGENKAPSIFVGASAENSGIRFQRDVQTTTKERDASHRRHQIIWARIDEAATIAGLSGPVNENFQAALQLVISSEGWYSRSATATDRSTIFNAIDQWLTAARGLLPPRRSAALFAADQLLEQSEGFGWRKDANPVIRQRLEALGAKFNWLELGEGYEYRHAWLKEALQINPDGRAGELAFLTLMERGFETSAACLDQHSEGFGAVIAKGAEYLRRKPDSPIQSDIHFLMAQAYDDIFALAAGGGPESGPSDKFQSEVPSARTHAIAQYRLAFNTGSNTPRARAAWPEAWRAVAGLPPARLHFFCYYD